MTIQELLNSRNMSIYRLAKASKVPYATCNDIINGKTKLEKCSAETVYRLAQTLNISMEELLAPCFIKRSSFENFKSTVCHRVKEKGDIDFIIEMLESQEIRIYFERKWYPECLYLLAMLDYLSRLNDVPICDDYDDIRKYRLEKTVFPTSLIAMSLGLNDEEILNNAINNSIPEFRKYNIIESEVRNVV